MAKRKFMGAKRSSNLFRKTANRTNVRNLVQNRQGMRGGFHF